MVTIKEKKQLVQLKRELSAGSITRKEFIQRKRALGFQPEAREGTTQRVYTTPTATRVTKTEEGTRVENLNLKKSDNIQAIQSRIDAPISNRELLGKLNTPSLSKQQAQTLVMREAYRRREEIPERLSVKIIPKDKFPIKPEPKKPKSKRDIYLENVAEATFEREQRLQASKQSTYLSLGIQDTQTKYIGGDQFKTVSEPGAKVKIETRKRKSDFARLGESLQLGNLLKAGARFPIEVGSGAIVKGGRIYLEGVASYSEKGREALREVRKPGAVIERIGAGFDPRTSAGVVNIGATLFQVQKIATATRVQRALKQPKTEYKIKYETKKVVETDKGFKTQVKTTYDKPTGDYIALGKGKNFIQAVKKTGATTKTQSIKTVFGRKLKVDTVSEGAKGKAVVSIEKFSLFPKEKPTYTPIKTFTYKQSPTIIQSTTTESGKPFYTREGADFSQELSNQKITQLTDIRAKTGTLNVKSITRSYKDLRASAGLKDVASGEYARATLPKGKLSFVSLGKSTQTSPTIKFTDTASQKLDVLKFGEGGTATYIKQPTVRVSQTIIGSTKTTGIFTPKQKPTIFGKRGSFGATLQKEYLLETVRPTSPTPTYSPESSFFLPGYKSSPIIVPVSLFDKGGAGSSKQFFRDTSIPKPKRKTYNIPSTYKPRKPGVMVKRLSDSKIDNEIDLRGAILPRYKKGSIGFPPIVDTIPIQSTIPKQIIQPDTKPSDIILPTYRPGRPQPQPKPTPLPPPITPITIFPVVPAFDFGGNIFGTKKRKGKQIISKIKYKADVTSKIFGLTTTKTPSFITPFTNRPIVIKKKKKPKKSTKKTTKKAKRKKK